MLKRDSNDFSVRAIRLCGGLFCEHFWKPIRVAENRAVRWSVKEQALRALIAQLLPS